MSEADCRDALPRWQSRILVPTISGLGLLSHDEVECHVRIRLYFLLECLAVGHAALREEVEREGPREQQCSRHVLVAATGADVLAVRSVPPSPGSP